MRGGHVLNRPERGQPSTMCLISRIMSFEDCLRAVYDFLMSSKDSRTPLLAFQSLVGLATQVGSGAARFVEEAGKDGLDKGSEDELSAVGHWKRHPEDQDELEGIVEGCQSLASFFEELCAENLRNQ
jgi:hypothetical protein